MRSCFIFKKVLTPVLLCGVLLFTTVQADELRRRKASSTTQRLDVCSFAMDSNAVKLSSSTPSGRPISDYEALLLLHRFFNSSTIQDIHLINGKSIIFPDMMKKCSLVGNQLPDNSSGMFSLTLTGDSESESFHVSFSEFTNIRILRFHLPRVIQFSSRSRAISNAPVVIIQFERLPNGSIQVDLKDQTASIVEARHVKCVFN
jgi:hypothetical protein